MCPPTCRTRKRPRLRLSTGSNLNRQRPRPKFFQCSFAGPKPWTTLNTPRPARRSRKKGVSSFRFKYGKVIYPPSRFLKVFVYRYADFGSSQN
jgi:hypothetical protein